MARVSLDSQLGMKKKQEGAGEGGTQGSNSASDGSAAFQLPASQDRK